MAIFTHIVLGTNDLERARKFYDQTLSALGVKRVMNMDNASLWGTEGPEFMVTKPANGQPATHANGGTIGFAAPDRASVHAFHEKALAAGGTCEGPPGPAQLHAHGLCGLCARSRRQQADGVHVRAGLAS